MASLRDVLPAPRNVEPASQSEVADGTGSPLRVAPAVNVVVASAPLGAGATSVLALTAGTDGQPDFSAIARAGENATRVVHADHSAIVEKPRDASLQRQLTRPNAEAVAETAKRTREALDPIVRGKVSASLPANFRGRDGAAHQTAEFVRYTPASTNLADPTKQRIIKMVQAPVDPMEPPRFSQKKTPAAPPSPPVPVLHSPTRKLTKEEAADWIVPPAISNWKNNRGYTVPLDKRLASDATSLRDTSINDKFAALAETMYAAERTAREEVEQRAFIQRNVSLKAKEAKERQLRDLAARAREERAGFVSNRAESDAQSQFLETRAGLSASRMDGAVARKDAPPPSATTENTATRNVINTASALETSSVDGSPRRRPRSSRSPGNERDGSSLPSSRKDSGDVTADDIAHRDAIRYETRRRRERELRLRGRHDDDDLSQPTLKRSKLSRDEDRDIAERVALGQRAEGVGVSTEVMYDQRLFNEGSKARGMAAGFGGQDADALYDKPLFEQGQSKFQYNPKANAGVGVEECNEERSISRFRPHQALGVENGNDNGAGGLSDGPRTRPVEFERDAVAANASTAAVDDPFGLDDMLGKMSKSKQ